MHSKAGNLLIVLFCIPLRLPKLLNSTSRISSNLLANQTSDYLCFFYWISKWILQFHWRNLYQKASFNLSFLLPIHQH
ncbi:unnamed protein product [Lactuca saligna]|uniref:Secreted protein n=1 Tax=Lactuca saligna TaxID=75948 RepID=A0AA35VF46_LACSI|nr:unnamed protein product [Lactuca saligna]